MKPERSHTIRTKPFFLLLLPLFFVLHGFTENYGFVPVSDAALLTGIYLAWSVVIAAVGWLLFRNTRQACLLAFLVMALHFFFGTLHDTLKQLFPGSFIVKYSVLLPVLSAALLLVVILMKRKKPRLLRTTYYLNILLLVLLAIDGIWLTGKIIRDRKQEPQGVPQGFIACPGCPKPDIYFIVPDEYAGNTELKDLFQFDNSAFISQLDAKDFHTIPQSYSNYNYTPFSIASVLNMDYLQLSGRERNQPDLTYCYEMIWNNRLLRFLESQGYSFYNYSVFDFEGQPARTNETFLPNKTRLITSQTLLSRIRRDIAYNLITRFQSKKYLRKVTYSDKENNENIYNLTWKIAEERSGRPKFVYTHLEMPHYPYYFDRNGKEQPFETLLEGQQGNKEHYIEYLQYTNKKLLDLVDHIRQFSLNQPIIILMGDHGFRHFTEPVLPKYHFLNLVSLYMPSRNYGAFHDSLSSVNLFRILLNTGFSQQLPYLKDSTSYLRD